MPPYHADTVRDTIYNNVLGGNHTGYYKTMQDRLFAAGAKQIRLRLMTQGHAVLSSHRGASCHSGMCESCERKKRPGTDRPSTSPNILELRTTVTHSVGR